MLLLLALLLSLQLVHVHLMFLLFCLLLQQFLLHQLLLQTTHLAASPAKYAAPTTARASLAAAASRETDRIRKEALSHSILGMFSCYSIFTPFRQRLVMCKHPVTQLVFVCPWRKVVPKSPFLTGATVFSDGTNLSLDPILSPLLCMIHV